MMREIADSDDDLDGDEGLPLPLNNGDWSEPATRSTGSTDPILFQRVLAEQSEAANNVNRNESVYFNEALEDTQMAARDVGDLYDVPSSPIDAPASRRITKSSATSNNSLQPQAIGSFGDINDAIGSSSSLIIIPEKLSMEEQGQYQAFDMASTDSYPPTAGPSTMGHNPSSAATVLNTPGKRTLQEVQHDELQMADLGVAASTVAGAEEVPGKASPQDYHTPRPRSRRSMTRKSASAQELSLEEDYQPVVEETPVKTKKRGRPSRKRPVPEDNDAVEEPVTKIPSKKRGRPRKAAPVSEEVNDEDEEKAEELVTKVQQKEMAIASPNVTDEPSTKSIEALPDSDEDLDEPAFVEPEELAVKKNAETSSEAKKTATPPAAASLLKQAHRPAVLAPADKPIYRVGLSRRQRMPSLLKMVPKK